jgi:hypothetical protein
MTTTPINSIDFDKIAEQISLYPDTDTIDFFKK